MAVVVVLATLLLTAACLVVCGVSMLSTPAGLIAGGVLLAGWSLVVFGGGER